VKQIPVIQNPSALSPSVPAGSDTAGMVGDPERTAALRPEIVKALSTVFDPEIPVNIFELGLIYDIIVDASSRVGIRMTLTAPACPAAQTLPVEVRRKVAQVPGVADAKVDIVWDPPWDRDRMSDAAKLQLGMF
jgi:FeS assembly SUF system protein